MIFKANIELKTPLKPAGITDELIYDIDITFNARNTATAGRIIRTIIDRMEINTYYYWCISEENDEN